MEAPKPAKKLISHDNDAFELEPLEPEYVEHSLPGSVVDLQSRPVSAVPMKTETSLSGSDDQLVEIPKLKTFMKGDGKSGPKAMLSRALQQNKVLPISPDVGEMERPSSAPERHRKPPPPILVESKRPNTASFSPRPFSLPLKQDSLSKLPPNIEVQPEEPRELSTSQSMRSKKNEMAAPAVNETAYIPYEYAQRMIGRIVDDMKDMKTTHLSILARMEDQYQCIEKETQVQFDEFVSSMQGSNRGKVNNYLRIINLLRIELAKTQGQSSDALKSLQLKNKDLLKQKHDYLKARKDSVTAESTKPRPVAAVPQVVEHVAEDKISKDIQQTEKEEKDERDQEEGHVVVVPVLAEAEPRGTRKELEDLEDQAEDVAQDIDQQKDADAVVDVVSEDESEDEREEVEDGMSDKEDDDQEEGKLDHEDKVDNDVVDGVIVPVPVKKGILSSGKKDKQQKQAQKSPSKRVKPQDQPVHAAPVPVSSDREKKKLEKQLKDLEKKLAMKTKIAERDQKVATDAKQELQAATKEVTELKKKIALLEKEYQSLHEAAGAGAIALQKLPELKEEIKSLSSQNQTLVDNYNTERVLRKKYYNMVEDMKGRIRVYCRVRPLSKTEKSNNNTNVIQSPDDYTIKVAARKGEKEFQFDQIFTQSHSQADVFEDTNNLVQSAIDGYNVCIFAYGQTGSGKTYTMIGDTEQTQPGIAPRAFERIFNLIKENSQKFSFSVSCYMMELYNDKLIDLLVASGGGDSAKLDIKKDKRGMVFIQGAIVNQAENPAELQAIFTKGSANRHTASTKMNAESSRSHLVIGVVIESTNLTSGAITRGKLSLVDLAGSERVGKTGATADQLKEANSINKSLSALGDVISALSSEQSFIPYRNNKLTMMMQDSLGGNAKTLMFVNISPANYNSEESVTSLTYAARVKLITNDASKNAETKEVARLRQVIAKLKAGEDVDDLDY
ncbi:uncharacterized protein LOC100187504 [Ciona intestinalis]